VELLAMSKQVVVFNPAPNTLILYRFILTSQGFEVLAFGQEVKGLTDVEGLHPRLLIIDHISGYNETELDLLYSLQMRPALAFLPILLVTSARDILTRYPILLAVSNVSILVHPFGYRDFVASVEQALDGRRSDASSATAK
jgi:two-component system, OmpR family, response regulator VicR